MAASVAPSPVKPLLRPEQETIFAKLPQWLHPAQVAEMLGKCTTEHVRVLREKGAIEARDFRSPGAKVGTYRFYKESVRLYLATRPDPANLFQ